MACPADLRVGFKKEDIVHWGGDKEVKAGYENDLESWTPDFGLLHVTI
jgi:hypothetical protein